MIRCPVPQASPDTSPAQALSSLHLLWCKWLGLGGPSQGSWEGRVTHWTQKPQAGERQERNQGRSEPPRLRGMGLSCSGPACLSGCVHEQAFQVSREARHRVVRPAQ